MKKFSKVVVVVMLMLTMSLAAHAANIYKDTYTTEDGSGKWTFTDIEVTGTSTLSQEVVSLSVVAATPATLTTAQSGTTFVVDDAATRTTTFCSTFTLPPAASGLVYKFISGDGSGMTIRSSDTNYVANGYSDIFEWGTNPGGVATAATLRTSLVLERGALGATGTQITVYGYTAGSVGKWYTSIQAGTIPTVQLRQRETNPVCQN